jgi:hypothetical protein
VPLLMMINRTTATRVFLGCRVNMQMEIETAAWDLHGNFRYSCRARKFSVKLLPSAILHPRAELWQGERRENVEM